MTHRLQDRLERLEQVTAPAPPLRVVLVGPDDPDPDDKGAFVVRFVGAKHPREANR